jgi:hypothetical protein
MKHRKRIFECCSCGCDLRQYDSYFDFNGDLYCEECVEKERRWTDDLPDEEEIEEWNSDY